MNYFKGYKKKGRVKFSKPISAGFVGDFTKSALTFGLGSQIVSQPQFGAIGQQGAAGLAVGAGFLPSIATIGVGGIVIKKVKKLGKK